MSAEIRFCCATCKATMSAPVRSARKKINCLKCGQRLQIPEPTHAQTVLAPLAGSSVQPSSLATPQAPQLAASGAFPNSLAIPPPPPPQPANPRGLTKAALVWMIAGGASVLILIVVLVLVFALRATTSPEEKLLGSWGGEAETFDPTGRLIEKTNIWLRFGRGGEGFELVLESGSRLSGAYRIDARQRPTAIDLDTAGRTEYGILAFDGDILRISTGPTRPTTFGLPKAFGVAHLHLKRIPDSGFPGAR